MVDQSKKDYFFTVVSEDVEIVLKTKFFFNGSNSKVVQFVQGNQLERQELSERMFPFLTVVRFSTALRLHRN